MSRHAFYKRYYIVSDAFPPVSSRLKYKYANHYYSKRKNLGRVRNTADRNEVPAQLIREVALQAL
jgi:hypothetical protein